MSAILIDNNSVCIIDPVCRSLEIALKNKCHNCVIKYIPCFMHCLRHALLMDCIHDTTYVNYILNIYSDSDPDLDNINSVVYFSGNTIMHDLCILEKVSIDALRALEYHGADHTIKNNQGFTPYELYKKRVERRRGVLDKEIVVFFENYGTFDTKQVNL